MVGSPCDYFLIDKNHSTDDMLRASLPILEDTWFIIPTNTIEEFNEIGSATFFGKKVQRATITFKHEFEQLNTILPAFREVFFEEHRSDLESSRLSNEENFTERWRPRWRPPWTWSRCAKCKLEVNTFITVSVVAVTVGLGHTSPGALATAKALIAGKYGLAAWEAVKAGIFNEGVGRISAKICAATGKC